MTVKSSLRLTILGFAGYGGYTLWKSYGNRFRTRAEVKVHSGTDRSARRILERSELIVTGRPVGSDEPAAELLVPRQP